jgi:hypothetical protein
MPYIENLMVKRQESFPVISFDIDKHDNPTLLQTELQDLINSLKDEHIKLVYGICGNATKGLRNPYGQLSVLRVHDCLTVLLGSNKQYFQLIGANPGLHWVCKSTVGHRSHSLRYEQFQSLYGAENAAYLVEVLGGSGPLHYLSLGDNKDHSNIVDLSKTEHVVILDGSLSLLEDYIFGNSSFELLLNENEAIKPIYDDLQVIVKDDSDAK